MELDYRNPSKLQCAFTVQDLINIVGTHCNAGLITRHENLSMMNVFDIQVDHLVYAAQLERTLLCNLPVTARSIVRTFDKHWFSDEGRLMFTGFHVRTLRHPKLPRPEVGKSYECLVRNFHGVYTNLPCDFTENGWMFQGTRSRGDAYLKIVGWRPLLPDTAADFIPYLGDFTVW